MSWFNIKKLFQVVIPCRIQITGIKMTLVEGYSEQLYNWENMFAFLRESYTQLATIFCPYMISTIPMSGFF